VDETSAVNRLQLFLQYLCVVVIPIFQASHHFDLISQKHYNTSENCVP
jgi:hypothetical protein